MRNAPMIALTALCFLFGCKNPGGDDSTSSSTSSGEQCTEGFEGGPEVDANYPACGCLPERCSDGAACFFEGLATWTSSVCLPPCTQDSDCPMLAGKPTTCFNEYCRLLCDTGDDTCPAGYTCGQDRECQVKL